MTFLKRATLIWPAMTLAGLAVGGYVYAAWPVTAPKPTVNAQTVRTTASVVASDAYSDYDVSRTPLLDAVIQAPATVDVR